MSPASIHISIISPVFEAAALVPRLVAEIQDSMQSVTEAYELILVEDGSQDASWAAIKAASQVDSRIKGVKLSRNFGQHEAITAGLDQARGEWIVVMDCDLQDRPQEIPRLYDRAQQGYDAVLAQRVQRRDSWLQRFFSRSFYRILSYLSGIPQDATVANFGIYHRKVIDVVRSMREKVRYFPVFVRWAGFRVGSLPVEHGAKSKASTYSFGKRLNLAIRILLAFSDKPLVLLIRLGLWMALGAFLFALYIFIRAQLGAYSVAGWASLIISVWFFSGLIISTLGLVGLYVARVFEEVKQRPIYVVETQTYVRSAATDPLPEDPERLARAPKDASSS